MIALLGASALAVAALQASIAGPTSAFRGCLHGAVDKATHDKVGADGIEGYLKNACSSEMGSLKSAIVAFRMKNGMSKKAAGDDADMTVDDYVSTPADNYKFLATQNMQATPKTEPAKMQPASSPQASPQPQ